MIKLHRAIFFLVVFFGVQQSSVKGEMIIVESVFDSDADGWITQDVDLANPNHPPNLDANFTLDYNSSGGNPGGFISDQDPSGSFFYFAAPSKFLGNMSIAFGGEFNFDLVISQEATTSAGNNAGVIFVGADTTLKYGVDQPSTIFSTFSVPLNSTSDWFLYTNNAIQPTDGEILNVLGNLNAIYIREEWVSAVGETTSLDNVQFTSTIPEPSTFALMIALCVSLAGIRQFTRRTNR